MKKVLVTGASGFIGRYCLPFLQEKGYEIFAMTSSKNTLPDYVRPIPFDLLGPECKHKMMASIQPSHLLHLAWETEHGKFWSSSKNLDWIKASIDLVQAFVAQQGMRAVLAGTCAEYDWDSTEFNEEKTLCKPQTLYGSSKLALYLALLAYAKTVNLSFGWGRIFYLYGIGEHPNRFIPSIIRGLIKKNTIPCSHCEQIKDFLHVQDVANAFVSLLESPVQGAVNIGSGKGVKLKEIVNKLADHLGGQDLIQFGALPVSQKEPLQLVADAGRLREELKWSPKFYLEFSDTINWWKNHNSE